MYRSLAVAGLVSVVGVAFAQEAGDVAALVRALGADDPGERDRATQALLAAGAAARPALESARAHADVEVSSRARFILDFLPWEAACPGIARQVGDLPYRLQSDEPAARRALIEDLLELRRGGAAAVLAAMAEDPDETVRSLAVLALARLGDRRAVEPLRRIARREAPGDFQEAMLLLGALGDPAAIPDLVKNLSDEDTYMRRRAVDALIALDRSEAIPAVRELAGRAGPIEIRGSAALVLAHIGDAGAIPTLTEYARHWDADARRRTAVALGALGDPAALPALQRMSKDNDSGPRHAAVQAMGLLRGADVAQDLVPFLADGAWEIRAAARAGLARCPSEGLARAASAVLENPAAGPLRAYMLEVLERRPVPGVLPAVLKLLGQEDRVAKAAAARAAGAYGDASAVGPLTALAAGREPSTAEAALEALGALKAAGAEEEMLRRLGDPEPRIRAAAARGLGRLGRAAAAVSLRPALGDEVADVRSAAADALGALGDREARAALGGLLDDTDPGVRRAAARALRALADPALVPVVAPRVASGDPWMRAWAIATLGRCGGPEAVAIIRKAAGDFAAPVRQAAAASLATVPGDVSLPLLRRLAADPSPEVRLEAVRSRLAQGDAAASGPLGALIVEPAAPVRAQAAMLAGRYQVRGAARALVEILADEREVDLPGEEGRPGTRRHVWELALEALEAATGEKVEARTDAARIAGWRARMR